MKNWSYKIPEGEHKGEVLWSGRYSCVAAFVFRRIGEEWFVLANLRGPGTPDYQGCWNAVCGFLEADESAEEGCSREISEETGYVIKPEKFLQVFTHTDPATTNKAHVTIRHLAILFEDEDISLGEAEGGEENEVSKVSWIPVDAVDEFKWAFNHQHIIEELFQTYIEPLYAYEGLCSGDFFMLGHPEWLNDNPKVKKIIKSKILSAFEIYD